MRYTSFQVKNFKGIRDLVLERSKAPTGGVVTLVGLNESGKTTVLESLYAFAPGAEDLNPLQLPGFVQNEPEDSIPIARMRSSPVQSILLMPLLGPADGGLGRPCETRVEPLSRRSGRQSLGNSRGPVPLFDVFWEWLSRRATFGP